VVSPSTFAFIILAPTGLSSGHLFKLSIVGSYHKVSKKYLPLYITEAQFRYNNRHNADIFGAAVSNF
jgi:hypothetical protein